MKEQHRLRQVLRELLDDEDVDLEALADPRYRHLLSAGGRAVAVANAMQQIDLARTHVDLKREETRLKCIRLLHDMEKNDEILAKLEKLEAALRADTESRQQMAGTGRAIRADNAPTIRRLDS